MTIQASSPEDYIAQLPPERAAAISQLRSVINENIPEGFREGMSYNMIGWVVPHQLYPPGYHCDPKLPLPFLSIASQKNFIAVYHMGVYAHPELHDWFVTEFDRRSSRKLDMGKSCIRFKNPEHIPFDLIGELAAKLSVADWVGIYETQLKR